MDSNPMFEGNRPMTVAEILIMKHDLKENKVKGVTRYTMLIKHPYLVLSEWTVPATTYSQILTKCKETLNRWHGNGLLTDSEKGQLEDVCRQHIVALTTNVPPERPTLIRRLIYKVKSSVHKGRPKGSLNKKSKAKVTLDIVHTKHSDEEKAGTSPA